VLLLLLLLKSFNTTSDSSYSYLIM